MSGRVAKGSLPSSVIGVGWGVGVGVDGRLGARTPKPMYLRVLLRVQPSSMSSRMATY